MKSSKSNARKRFYKSATMAELEDGAFGVLLDGRRIKTPAGRAFFLPTHGLAEAVAEEWNAQGETIVPASLPLTKFTNTAIDLVSERRIEVTAEISKFAASDLVCYRAEYPEALVAAQSKAWDPVLKWAKARYGAQFVVASGILPVEQPAASLAAISAAVGAFGAFKLTALHVMTTLAGSALFALAHVEGELDAARAWAGAHTDENWQIARWGADCEAAVRQKARLAEFEAASRFFQLS